MTRRLWVVLAVFSVLAPDSAHAQSQKAHAGSDTLPATVAKRSLEAYNRHDLTALQSNYDTVFTHELLGTRRRSTRERPRRCSPACRTTSPRTRSAQSSNSRS